MQCKSAQIKFILTFTWIHHCNTRKKEFITKIQRKNKRISKKYGTTAIFGCASARHRKGGASDVVSSRCDEWKGVSFPFLFLPLLRRTRSSSISRSRKTSNVIISRISWRESVHLSYKNAVCANADFRGGLSYLRMSADRIMHNCVESWFENYAGTNGDFFIGLWTRDYKMDEVFLMGNILKLNMPTISDSYSIRINHFKIRAW